MQTQPLKTQVAKYGDIMPIMIRVVVEKFKNSQNKPCLPSLLCHLMCPGYCGSDFLIFALEFCPLPKAKKIRESPKYPNTQNTSNDKEEKVGKPYVANS